MTDYQKDPDYRMDEDEWALAEVEVEDNPDLVHDPLPVGEFLRRVREIREHGMPNEDGTRETPKKLQSHGAGQHSGHGRLVPTGLESIRHEVTRMRKE
jgi:hypothetical protein